jgi:glycine oxidase
MDTWDAVVVGQGIAGTTLAWQLTFAGQRVLLLDPNRPHTTSKIAAGLITPITGQRLAMSWQVETFFPAAREFYARVAALTGVPCFHERTAIRLFRNDDERARWSVRRHSAEFQRYLCDPQPEPLVEPTFADDGGGGFAMHTAQLDVPRYLETSRQWFAEQGSYRQENFTWSSDLALEADSVRWQAGSTRYLISCEGYAASANPYFSWVPFKAAKGDILTIRFAQPLLPRSLHAGLWLAPTADPCVFKVGSTYDWHHLDDIPNPQAAQELIQRLRSLIHLPFEVLAHHAAVRPIIQESKALIGKHPVHPALGYFNGLGSKGSLHAPWFAAILADHLVQGTPIPNAFDLRKNF